VFLLSAGLSLLTERINEEIRVDGYLANDLIVRNGFLRVDVKVNVSFYNKDRVPSRVLRTWKLKMEDCVSVGDDPHSCSFVQKSRAFNSL